MRDLGGEGRDWGLEILSFECLLVGMLNRPFRHMNLKFRL